MKRILVTILCLYLTGCETVPESKSETAAALHELDAETREYLEKAQSGNTEAQNRLAIKYLNGEGGLEKSEADAYTWFTKSSQGGNLWAMSNLGRMYRDGTGVEQNVIKAKSWFTKSAEAGNHQAMANLGEIYAAGYGQPVDFEKASTWYGRALLGDFDPFIANNAAWFFSTVEDESLLKPELAISLMLKVISMRQRYYEFDTLAAAYAAKGDFDNAIMAQQEALVLGYEGNANEAEMADFENRLGVYFDRERYIFFKQ